VSLSVHEDTSAATSTTNTDLDFYDSTNDSDIQFTVTGGNLSVAKGQELHIWNSKKFAPGGTVTLNGNAAASPDGDLHIDDNGVFVLGGDISVAGNWAADAGSIFTATVYNTNYTAVQQGKLFLVYLQVHQLLQVFSSTIVGHGLFQTMLQPLLLQ